MVAGAVCTVDRVWTAGVLMSFLSAFGTYCFLFTIKFSVSKFLAVEASQRVWDIEFNRDVHICSFNKFW